MGQMPAVGKAHTHDRITGGEQGKIYGGVCLRAGMGLHVCKLCAEQLLCALNGEIFCNVHALATAVVTLPGVSLGVLVGQDAALCDEYRLGYDVFGGNQFNAVLFSLKFRFDCRCNLRVGCSQAAVEFLNHGDSPFSVGYNFIISDFTGKSKT